MEEVFGFFVCAGLALAIGLVGIVLGVLALSQMAGLRNLVNELRWEVETLRREGAVPASRPAQTPAGTPATAHSDVPATAFQTPPVVGVPPTRGAAVLVGTGAHSGRMAPSYSGRPIPRAMPMPASDRSMQDLESKIGQRWIAWVGAIVVFLSVVFFLKYAFQNDWIGPTGQVVICVLGGAALAAGGSYFIAKQWRIFGQCLMGLGLAILYASFYGAFQLYPTPVMGQSSAFAAMVLVTIAGMTLAVMHEAVSMAFIALLGGLLTPVLLSTGHDSRDVLFSYLLILDLGVMGVAFFRGWRMLDALALAGTLLLYLSWWASFYTPAGLWPAVAWLGGIYAIFLVLPFTYHLVQRTPVTVERFIMAVVNAAFAASLAWYMLRTDYLFTMGFVCLAMAACYVAIGVLIRLRAAADIAGLMGTIAMSVTFLTLAVPMQLHAHGILLAWVAEAPVLAYVAYRFNYQPLRVMSFLVLVVATGRLFLSEAHWPMHQMEYVPFANKQFLSALTVPLAAGIYALVHYLHRAKRSPADWGLQLAAACGGGLVALIILNSEIRGWVERALDYEAGKVAVTALWALGALTYVAASEWMQRGKMVPWAMALGVLLIAGVLGLDAYQDNLAGRHILFANARFGVWLLVLAGGFTLAWSVRRSEEKVGPGTEVLTVFTLVASLLTLLMVLSTEVYTFCTDYYPDAWRAERSGQMSITLVWSVYAAGLLWVGFWKRWRWVRYGGLALFGLAALKLILFDLSFLRDIYRIVSFLVLGVLMLAASYFYHKLEKRLTAVPPAPPSPDAPTPPPPPPPPAPTPPTPVATVGGTP